jgi:hypothetical protein
MATDNPLSTLSDDVLWNAQILLQIACLRKLLSVPRKRNGNLCLLGTALQLEAANRGVFAPQAPFSVGDLRKV